MNIVKKNILVLVAAAGKSSRMGQCKALLKIDNSTFMQHMLQTLLGAGLTNIFITLPEQPHYDLCYERAKIYPIKYSKNLWPNFGLTGSIKTALDSRPKTYDALLICPIDMPFLSHELINNFAIALQQTNQNPAIIIPKAGNKRGHPVLFSRHFFKDLCSENNSQGPKSVIKANKSFIFELISSDSRLTLNINTQECYQIFLT